MAAQPHAATCDLCEWSHTAYNENEARIIAVIHVLIRHPDEYAATTGNDPHQKRYEYSDYVTAYRKVI
jgi:hypothetical protein